MACPGPAGQLQTSCFVNSPFSFLPKNVLEAHSNPLLVSLPAAHHSNPLPYSQVHALTTLSSGSADLISDPQDNVLVTNKCKSPFAHLQDSFEQPLRHVAHIPPQMLSPRLHEIQIFPFVDGSSQSQKPFLKQLPLERKVVASRQLSSLPSLLSFSQSHSRRLIETSVEHPMNPSSTEDPGRQCTRFLEGCRRAPEPHWKPLRVCWSHTGKPHFLTPNSFISLLLAVPLNLSLLQQCPHFPFTLTSNKIFYVLKKGTIKAHFQ